jgi:hypothetical protein
VGAYRGHRVSHYSGRVSRGGGRMR